ncbi:hypothetical protein GE09DRAFT_278181 [Coniochaeta sp. 2T2.1]|nr:hypothetical protein GE09DRAFT_278181 [Coniochaeta sp. 2T2.1]
MLPAGARALFSATRTRVTAAPSITICTRRQLDAKTFRTSSTNESKPSEDPTAPKLAGETPRKPAAENVSHEKTSDNAQPTSEPVSQSAGPSKEVARTGLGFSRARAWRGKTVEEMPPVNIPPYWSEEHVWPYDRIRSIMGMPNIGLPRISPELLTAHVDKLWPGVDDAFSLLKPLEAANELSAKMIHDHGQSMLERLQHARDIANWYLMAVSHHSHVGNGAFFWLEALSREKTSLSGFHGPKSLKRLRPEHALGPSELLGNVAAKLEQSEYSALAELVCRVRNELAAVPPKTKTATELNRPVTVLSVLNYKGSAVANEVVSCLAYELEANVLHLDARSIADIIGNYLGQTPYWSRGAISTLGYAAAEMNGRVPSMAESADDSDGTVTFDIPGLRRLGSLSSKKDLLLMGGADERWEDLKVTQALETLIRTLDAERSTSSDPSIPEPPVIIHVRDYIELGTLAEGILQRLRAVVDRLWRKGKRIVIVGSSSSDVKSAVQWRAQLAEMSKEDCHVIPFHAEVSAKVRETMEKADNTLENIRNLTNMLSALEGSTAATSCSVKAGGLLPKSQQVFEDSVLDLQAIYRLASLILGSSPKSIGPAELEDATSFLDWRDMRWVSRYPGVQPFGTRGSSITGSSGARPGANMSSDDGPDGPNGAPPTHEQQLDKYEKGLITGLINAKDIRTTFNDIVAPEPMVESIKALTSLSIIRPQAFSYGILKVERIPGLLMYGPPGTGKTLLAKAIAKESGANMLEISAATINNMYVGQSEKNVSALFRVARKLAPMIIFLDEGDALLGKRSDGHGHASRRVVLTQFLREMDGLTESNKQVFVIVATNRPFDLDEAILRRLPRKILVDLPLQPEREAILRILLKEETLDESISLATLAAETDLYSGSDLKNLCVAAAMDAVKEEMRAWTAAGSPKDGYAWPEKRVLTRKHFDAAVKEIGASISEDMESLKAIRKFDEQYGDASGRKRKRKKAMGFEVVPPKTGSEESMVRTLLA